MPHSSKAYMKEYLKEYIKRPEVKAKRQEYDKEYRKRQETKPLLAATAKRYREKDLVLFAARKREYRRKLREEVIVALGGKCACCGEKVMDFLSIDHINGGGRKHRLKVKYDLGVYRDIRNEGFPKNKYRVLCMNCNWAIGRLGHCPHQKKGKQK